MPTYQSALPALATALLFGASTPLAKLLGAEAHPVLLAGLLYGGSGIGLGIVLLIRGAVARTGASPARPPVVPRADLPWLAGAIVAGGILGPVLLMAGLRATSGASASLLLNVEGVFTALIAWIFFKENADRHIVAGMVAIVVGGAVLAWQPGAGGVAPSAMLIVAACLAWAVDNNLTRRISANDALSIACLKGLVAGAVNTTLGLLAGGHWPHAGALAATLSVGFAGYGLSLVLFVLALRSLGAARTGAYFSVAPLFGVITSLAIWPEAPPWTFWLAGMLMAWGVWIHLRERHQHVHRHLPEVHEHPHSHDAHHQHAHAFEWHGSEPHVHPHAHGALEHEHAHYPDLHHRHDHAADRG